jgi:hypothetical protein
VGGSLVATLARTPPAHVARCGRRRRPTDSPQSMRLDGRTALVTGAYYPVDGGYLAQ